MMWKILQYGNVIATDFYKSGLERDLDNFSEHWKPYNPKKHPGREGLSVTSLDGGFSGIPDLDSIREYCIENNKLCNTMIDSLGINKKYKINLGEYDNA